MKDFAKASLVRCIRTMAQTAVALITTMVAGNAFGGVMSDVNWQIVISASILAGILSILTSIATGLPEVEYAHHIHMSKDEPEDSEVEDYEVYDYGEEEEEGELNED